MIPALLALLALLARLGAAGDLPPLEHDPDEIRRTADEILGRPEYAPPTRSWLERLLDWIARRFDWLFGEGLSIGGSGGSTVLTIVVLVGAVLLVAFLVRNWRGPNRRRGDTDDVVFDVEAQRSADEWDAAAARAEAAGDWKEGLRCRFGGLVGRLVAAGAVAPVPGRTAGEFRADVRASIPEASGDFAAAADLFERAWYGDLPTGPEEAARFAACAERVLARERVSR